MVSLDCNSCTEKPCCRYRGWKVFFLAAEKQEIAEKYGENKADLISEYHSRSRGESVYAVDLPCPFLDQQTGGCTVYEARPFICRIFPVEVEPVTGTTYIDNGVCPKSKEAVFSPHLVQIAVDQWSAKFWRGSKVQQALE